MASIPANPTMGVHLDVRAHRRRPGAHGEVEHAAGARPDVVHGERLLGLGAQLQRLRQRPGGGRDAVVQERLVEMDVRLDQAGGQQPAAQVEALASRRRHEPDRDRAAVDRHVHHVVTVRQPHAA